MRNPIQCLAYAEVYSNEKGYNKNISTVRSELQFPWKFTQMIHQRPPRFSVRATFELIRCSFSLALASAVELRLLEAFSARGFRDHRNTSLLLLNLC